jgi:hypothetical protein
VAAPHNVPVRSARDRVVDLLGIGDTYPLTDLNVVADQLKVAFGGTAKIPIEHAQAGVTYQLCDPKGKPLGAAFAGNGEDATLVIETPKVDQDITYRILATKRPASGSTLPPQESRFLDEEAPVKVGLDTGLVIELRGVPLLDPNRPSPRPSDPRIVPYGQSVDVWIDQSQEGVQYSLILDGRDVTTVVRTGDLHDISLPTGPMLEDVVIGVRATKTFQASEGRASETSPLDATLYLKVMANPAATVAIDPSPIVDYASDVVIKVGGTQQSATYRAYLRTVSDADFVHDAASGTDIVRVGVPGKPDAQIRVPVESGVWRTPGGYAPVGGDAAGGGGDLRITAPSVKDDAAVIVQALKAHRVDVNDPASATISSAIRLSQSAVVLVRPDPARALSLRVPVVGADTGSTIQVSGGQPGVFYYFRRAPSGNEFPLPVYFHKRDEQDPTQNKGVGQLGIEIDFAIATDQAASPGANRATVFPRPPLLDVTPFATASRLSSRAVKAQTGVEAAVSGVAAIAAVPAIRADQAVIDLGTSARILIPSSNAADQYELTREGVTVRPAVAGNGSDLTMVSDSLTADAVFDVVVTRPGNTGIRVERVVQVPVSVRPDATLPVSAKQESVASGAGTEIAVQNSQRGVLYQLRSGQTAVGASLSGTGSELSLPTGPVTAETTFSVSATRADKTDVTVVLVNQATVKVKT